MGTACYNKCPILGMTSGFMVVDVLLYAGPSDYHVQSSFKLHRTIFEIES